MRLADRDLGLPRGLDLNIEDQLREHPWDWELWLDYAGQLLEEGDVRGSLIGLERRLVTSITSEDKALFRRRIDDLVAKNQSRWLHPWRPPLGTALRWHHGFVREVVFQRVDDVRAVFSALDGLWSHPTGRFLAAAHFQDLRLGPSGAEVLAFSRAVASLSALSFENTAIGSDGVGALAGSSMIRALRSLSVRRDRAGDKGAEHCARSDVLRGLVSLDLSRNQIGDTGAHALARAQGLVSLRTLTLDDNRIADAGAIALARSESLSALSHLNLERNPIQHGGRKALAQSTTLRCLLRI